jgi:nucleoside-diphosphate-sugar epimerase
MTKDFEQNIIATYNLIEAMRKSASCKKILFASTSTVYERGHKDANARELWSSRTYIALWLN